MLKNYATSCVHTPQTLVIYISLLKTRRTPTPLAPGMNPRRQPAFLQYCEKTQCTSRTSTAMATVLAFGNYSNHMIPNPPILCSAAPGKHRVFFRQHPVLRRRGGSYELELV